MLRRRGTCGTSGAKARRCAIIPSFSKKGHGRGISLDAVRREPTSHHGRNANRAHEGNQREYYGSGRLWIMYQPEAQHAKLLIGADARDISKLQNLMRFREVMSPSRKQASRTPALIRDTSAAAARSSLPPTTPQKQSTHPQRPQKQCRRLRDNRDGVSATDGLRISECGVSHRCRIGESDVVNAGRDKS